MEVNLTEANVNQQKQRIYNGSFKEYNFKTIDIIGIS